MPWITSMLKCVCAVGIITSSSRFISGNYIYLYHDFPLDERGTSVRQAGCLEFESGCR